MSNRGKGGALAQQQGPAGKTLPGKEGALFKTVLVSHLFILSGLKGVFKLQISIEYSLLVTSFLPIHVDSLFPFRNCMRTRAIRRL